MQVHPNVVREGVVTGVLGGSAVAVWFLIVDLIAANPFFTPVALGEALFRAAPGPPSAGTALLLAAGYTVFHFAAFAAVGTLAALLLHLAERQTALLALLVVFFVVFEMGFYGLVAILHATRLLNGLEWHQIAVGNLMASLVMGTHLWRTHPALATELSRALSH